MNKQFKYRLFCMITILGMLITAVGMPTGVAHAASSVTISGSAGVAGATITANGNWGYDDSTATSDGSGNYSVTVDTNWLGRWSGTVTPSKAGYSFSPSSRTYSGISSNQTNQNYTAAPATYTISGSVGSAGGGATITYDGSGSYADGSTTASGSGSYSFTIEYGWSGTVTPTKTGYNFSPLNRSYTNVASNQTNQNYTATPITYTISGNAGASSVTITYTGGSTTSNSSGNYSFTVSPNWSGTVVPSKTGFSFTPTSRTYSNVNANQSSQDYTARPTAFRLGSISDAHGEAAYFSTTANQLASLNPAIVLYNGDLENEGFVLSEMNLMVNMLKSTNLFNKTFLVRGNADNHVTGSAGLWENYFETAPNIKVPPAYVTNIASLNSSSDQLDYSFDYGNSIFIGLDVPGDIDFLTTDQMDFLDARLTYAEGAGLTHAFIFFHGPEYPVESNHSLCSLRADATCTPPALMTIINNHPIVSATIHGHEHVLAWTHMDATRVAGLTRSYEQFIASPAGGASYHEYLYPERVDYAYTDMENSNGFATFEVNGLEFTVKFYKTGTSQPVWLHTFSKINTPPTISDIADQTTNEDTATGDIPFTVGDVETSTAYLTVTASSSDTTVVPNENISLDGSGANRTINITPAFNQSGSATITVSVNDGTATISDTFLLTVNAVNDIPVADPQFVNMFWNTSIDIVLTGSDVEGSPLTYSIDDEPDHGSLSGSGANQTYTPTTNYSGADSFSFKVNDETVDSLPATVSINITAHTISGNAGIAGATLSYTIGATPMTVTADGAGLYSLQVPTDWSGTVTPSKAGYSFSPASMTYTNVLADQTAQNYTASILMFTISGNAGVAGATLSYTDGTPKTVTADDSGFYSFEVPYDWSGMVTPSLSGYGFRPGTKTYTNVTENQYAQDYLAHTSPTYYVDKTNPNCTDVGQVGSFAVPFCTITRGAYLATAGRIVHVLHGSYAETVQPEHSGTADNPITYWADPGVVVTGRPGTPTASYHGFSLGAKSYIVIDGFHIDNTSYKGISVVDSNHITITNNHVTRAGESSLTHPYEQGIYLKNTSYSTISYNTTDHNTCIGIRLINGSNYNLVSNNVSFSNYSFVETDAAGIETTGASYNTIINNITYSNEDSGINIYVNGAGTQSTHNLVIGNLSYENGDHGIDVNNSPYNTIVGNTVHGNGTVGINVEGETGTASHDTTVINNISASNGFAPPAGSFGGNLRVDEASISGTNIDYNLFNREDAIVQITWNGTGYPSLAAFRAAVPTQEVHGLEGDPLFVDPVPPALRSTGVPYVGAGIIGNYYPGAGSPAIDSANADAPSEPLTDIDGNARVDDPATPNTGTGERTYDDRGAYEFLPLGQSLPVVTTQAVTAITSITATGNGNVTATGQPLPTQHGVVWNTTGEPTVADEKTEDGAVSATGPFTSSMTSLTPGTLYHVRAYATNVVGTVYGEEVTFITLVAPTVTTQAVTDITTTTATGNGSITALGLPSPTQHGVVWSTSANPTTADNKTTDGPVSATGAFTSSITGLTPGTLYHVRAYATNAVGTSYGEDVTFTAYHLPSVSTLPVISITTTTATGNGDVTALGVPNPTQHGVVWSTSPNPTIANSKTTEGPVSTTGPFTSTMTGLTPGTLYYLRAYATNAAGTDYGDEVTFTTLLAPSVTTDGVTNITTTTATGNGNVTVLGTYNPTEHGVVWSTSANPTTADNKTTDGPVSETGPFTSSITGLTPGTLYHVRAYATSAAGTSYGEDVAFTALLAPTVTTQAVSSIGTTSAIGNGNVTVLGVPNPTQHGVVWSTSANPTVADSKTTDGDVTLTGPFTSSITGLTPGMLYHLRAYATNLVETVYGEEVTFTTLPSVTGTTTPVTNAGAGFNVTAGPGRADWANPGYVTADDTSYASATLTGSVLRSNYLESGNYGFAIPSNASIIGIQVTIGRHESGTMPGYFDVRDSMVSLLKDGVITGTNKAATGTEWPTTPAVAALYGNSADLWGTTWTPVDINDSDFGVALSVISDVNRIAYVDYMQISVTYSVTMVGATTAVNCGAGTPVVTYGSDILCVATVVRGSGSKTPTGNVSWTTNGSGSFLTSPCTLAGSDGTATCSVTYTANSVGSGSHLITATYSGDPDFISSNGNQTVTVNQKTASVTPDSASKTYGDADPTLSGTLTGFLPADGITATYSRTPGESVAGSPYTINATLSPTDVLANYNITYNTANFTITAKPITVTADPGQSKVLGATDPVFTYTSSDPGAIFTGALDREAGEDIGNYAIGQGTLDAGTNYAITFVSSDFTITPPTDEYILTLVADGNGTIVANPSYPHYHYGDVVNLTATPDVGWSFGSWSANVVDGKVTIYGDTTVTAIFTPIEYILTIVSDHGTVTREPDQSTYHEGDAVLLTVMAEAGWTFEGWTGALVSSYNPDSVTIHGDMTVTANYAEINFAPSFTSMAITSVDEDAVYTYNITAADANVGDTLTITAPTKPAWLTLTDNGDGTAVLTGNPTNAEVGSHDVVLQVNDGSLTGDQTFSIVVANTNDAPAFTSTPVTEGDEDTVYTYDITASDPDVGALLTISAPVKPEWLILIDNGDGTAVLSGTPGNGDVGINDVTLRVNDGTVDVDQVFTIDVGNTNDGPSFTSDPVTSVDEDVLYTYNITATDPDAGALLTISAPAKPAWLTLTDNGDGTATLTGTPANSEVGDHQVVLQVTDNLELASQSFTITVINANDAPVLAQPVDQNNAKDDVVNLQLSATDVDAGNMLTFSASGLPGGLSIDPSSGLISGTITGDANTYNVTAAVDDGNGGTDSKSFNWIVTDPIYTLTVTTIGGGTVTADKEPPYHLNDIVVLTAIADEGWTFSGWSGCTSADNTCAVTMDADKTVTATFTQNVYVLTITTVGSGTVTADKEPPYHLNDIVVLTAVADEGWTFSNWSGCTSADNTCAVTMDADKTVTATFIQTEPTHTVADFDGDGDTDISYFRPSTGRWYVLGKPSVAFGASGDIPVPADYNGDGSNDLAYFRPSNGRWYVSGQPSVAFGASGDIPVPGDYDSDGDADLAYFRPSNGRWYVLGQSSVAFGASGDIPVPADYDGDGDTDMAYFRPSNNRWYVLGKPSVAFGASGAIPVPGDYDGDGDSDLAYFLPSNNRWYVLGKPSVAYGASGAIPVPGDYDGDHDLDLAYFLPSNGRWYVLGNPSVAYGTSGDFPLPVRDTNGDGDPHQ